MPGYHAYVSYGTYSNIFADKDIRTLDQDLAHGVDVQRIITGLNAGEDGIEILEGPPEIEVGHRWKGYPAQLWRYPARRRT